MNLSRIGQKVKEVAKKIAKIYEKLVALALRLHLRKVEALVLITVLFEFLFPQASLAQTIQPEPSYRVATIMMEETLVSPESLAKTQTAAGFNNSLPEAAVREPKRVIWVTVTAYSSTVDQCDSSPCITASGYNVCANNQENVVAANFLPFGTTIKMPEEFGDRVFTVQDRMNAKYDYRIDIWMKSREAAREFGVKYVKVEIY